MKYFIKYFVFFNRLISGIIVLFLGISFCEGFKTIDGNVQNYYIGIGLIIIGTCTVLSNFIYNLKILKKK